jgi:hypothetical protein
VKQSGGAVGVGGGGKWDDFWPAGVAVNDGKKMSVTMGRRKWAYKVNMNEGKFLGGNRNMCRNSVSVAMNFCGLTGGTLASPGSNLSGHAMPNRTGGNEAAGSTNSRVGYIVEMIKNGTLEGKGNKRAKKGGGGVS